MEREYWLVTQLGGITNEQLEKYFTFHDYMFTGNFDYLMSLDVWKDISPELKKQIVANDFKSFWVRKKEVTQIEVPEAEKDDVAQSHKEAWNVWSHPLNHSTESFYEGKKQYWHKYTPEQYEALNKLLPYLEDRMGIPHKVFQYNASKDPEVNFDKKYTFYYSPRAKWNATEAAKERWKLYEAARKMFKGIYGHHNVSNKSCPGPALDIRKLNLLK